MPYPITRKLIIEQPNYDLQYVTEQENRDSPKRMYIEGQYVMRNKRNKNGRYYDDEDMLPAIQIFDEEYIKTNRAGGELNHSDKAEMDLGKLAHRILWLKQDSSNPNYHVGRSLIMNTPSGKILETLTSDGLKWGLSTKALGQISEDTDSKGSRVKSPILLGVDAVYDPSVSTAFVNGILENKEYIIADDGRIAEAYKGLEKNLSKYPTKHQDAIRQHIVESLQKFLKNI